MFLEVDLAGVPFKKAIFLHIYKFMRVRGAVGKLNSCAMSTISLALLMKGKLSRTKTLSRYGNSKIAL